MLTTDCWQHIFCFCDFDLLETIYIRGKKKIRTIFSNSHFLTGILKRQDILPQLLTQPIVSFIDCCQLVRLDQTRGTIEELLQMATQAGVSDNLLCELCCLNGRTRDVKEILAGQPILMLNIVDELLLMMCATHRGSIKNFLDSVDSVIVQGAIIQAVLHNLISVGATREDIMYFIDKDREFLSDHEDVVKPFLTL